MPDDRFTGHEINELKKQLAEAVKENLDLKNEVVSLSLKLKDNEKSIEGMQKYIDELKAYAEETDRYIVSISLQKSGLEASLSAMRSRLDGINANDIVKIINHKLDEDLSFQSIEDVNETAIEIAEAIKTKLNEVKG